MEHGGDIYGNKNIELDFSVNLSPIGPPQEVCRLLKEEDLTEILSSYPDPAYRELKQELSQKLELPEDWILCGNGASELLMAVVQAVRPKRAMIPVPSYQGYERAFLPIRDTKEPCKLSERRSCSMNWIKEKGLRLRKIFWRGLTD